VSEAHGARLSTSSRFDTYNRAHDTWTTQQTDGETWQTAAGGRDLARVGEALRRQSGLLQYLVSESKEDPNVIWVTDLWTSEQEHAEALKVPELRPFVEESMQLLEGMPEQIQLRPVGGKGPVP